MSFDNEISQKSVWVPDVEDERRAGSGSVDSLGIKCHGLDSGTPGRDARLLD